VNKYKSIVLKLKEKGVDVDAALSAAEIEYVEAIYGIKFPLELRRLFSVGLPISRGFYNWRDMSESNIHWIKEVILMPVQELTDEVREGVWCNSWGERPIDTEEALRVFGGRSKEAPCLVPIFMHRYIPFIPNSKKTPVFSIMGSDIIYYGTDLVNYLEHEFGFIRREDLPKWISQYKHIDFWSDLL